MPRTTRPILIVTRHAPLAGGWVGLIATAACLALCASGCGLTFQGLRAPTRTDGATFSNDPGNATGTPPGTSTPSSCVALGPASDANRLRMQQLVSEHRQRNNLNALAYSTTLEQAANDFALRMYREGFFSHEAPDGNKPGDRALAAGFCNAFIGENIAYGLNQVTSTEEAMDGFKNSPSHNENMLRERWDYIGVGYLHITSSQGDEYWWVQLFGTDNSTN